MTSTGDDYKIELDAYSGPLDLLLYLIRREEVDVYNIPIAKITQQYLQYLDLISALDINVAGEFVVMAATLMEIKSRMMVPCAEGGEEEEEMEDPRLDLVRQLMEYKRFKEAALELKARADARAERFSRVGEQPPGEERKSDPLPADLTLWVLLDAFSRILEQTGRRGSHRVLMDETPQEVFVGRLEQCASERGRLRFEEAFEDRSSRAVILGMFLAVLELVKRQVIQVEQGREFGEIWLVFVPEEQRIHYEEEAEPQAGEPAEHDLSPEQQEQVPQEIDVSELGWEDAIDYGDDLPDVPGLEGEKKEEDAFDEENFRAGRLDETEKEGEDART